MIEQQARLLDELEAAGLLTSAWRPSFERVSRHLFVPDIAWFGEDPPVSVSRLDDPDRWLSEVYEDQPIITQMDDGRTPVGGPPGNTPTSSLSMPTIVAIMLEEALIEDGMKILEIGTGSGWNAALLTSRLGPSNVFTIEVDPDIMAGARRSLADAGYSPVLIMADGTHGYEDAQPYDRVLATCSVSTVPYAWIAQTKPGGQVVVPWRTPILNGLLLRLEVAGDGSASGRFMAQASFMTLRAQRRSTEEVDTSGEADEHTTALHSGDVFDGAGAHLAAALLVRDCDRWTDYIDGAQISHLDDLSSGSWSVATFANGSDGPYAVRQGGTRRLWEEIEAAYDWWHEVGEPDFTRFGVTVTPQCQMAWLDQPDNVLSSQSSV